MKKDPFSKLKNAVALAAGQVARKEIDLIQAQRNLKAAREVLEQGINHAKDAKGTMLYIVSAGSNKISVIKAIREVTHIGLKEAKDIADNAVNALSQANLVGTFLDAERMNEAVWALHAAGAQTQIA